MLGGLCDEFKRFFTHEEDSFMQKMLIMVTNMLRLKYHVHQKSDGNLISQVHPCTPESDGNFIMYYHQSLMESIGLFFTCMI